MAYVSRRVDISKVERELGRLEHGPTDSWARFETVLAALFLKTQAVVHIETGSLKASGRIESHRRAGNWFGEIEYGGVSSPDLPEPDPGPARHVHYAEYEQRRGGAHDFMAPIDGADPGFVSAMMAWYDGEGGVW